MLVTGAGGFIGRHLVGVLRSAGVTVTALARGSCDLTDRAMVHAAVVEAAPQVVLHLAAARAAANTAERETTAAVNCMSGVWLLEAVTDECRMVIRLGSSTEYTASASPMDEQTPLQPRGFFGATKAAGSLMWLATARERGIRACVLRPFQVYGPGDKPGRLVPTMLAAARAGHSLPMTGPGLRRDWVWVGDVVDACLRAASRDDLPEDAVFNIGTGVQTSNEDLVAIAERVTGRSIITVPGGHSGRSWDTCDWVCDPRRARDILGWESKVDVATGLAHCWAAG